MKLKEFGLPRGGARPKFYYVDPPLQVLYLPVPQETLLLQYGPANFNHEDITDVLTT